MKFHRFRTPLFSVYSLSRPAPTAVRQPFTSNSDFHFPIPRVIMNHGLGFQDCTRLHLPKSKSDFPYTSILGSDSRLKHYQPSSLSLSYKLVFSVCSPLSLLSSLSSDFEIYKALYSSFTSKSFQFLNSTGLLVAVATA